MSTAEPIVQVTCYEVSCLPDGHPERRWFRLFVEIKDRYGWTIHDGGTCLDADGNLSDGLSVYGRDDKWITAHRFDLDTALQLAKQTAPKMTVNGVSVGDVLARTAHRVEAS